MITINRITKLTGLSFARAKKLHAKLLQEAIAEGKSAEHLTERQFQEAAKEFIYSQGRINQIKKQLKSLNNSLKIIYQQVNQLKNELKEHKSKSRL